MTTGDPHNRPTSGLSAESGRKAAVGDWQARVTGTLEGAERYSRFVHFMRILLPVIAFALIGVIVLFTIINKPNSQIALTYDSAEETAGLVAMTEPRFNGLDPEGRYYVVSADEAKRPAGRFDKVELTKVEAQIREDGEPRLSLNADKGIINIDANTLTFGPAVWVDLQDGFSFETDHAFADLTDGLIEGRTAVRGDSPFGTFYADRFEVDRKEEVVRLIGHVSFTINPASLQNAPDSLEELNDRRAQTRQQAEEETE